MNNDDRRKAKKFRNIVALLCSVKVDVSSWRKQSGNKELVVAVMMMR